MKISYEVSQQKLIYVFGIPDAAHDGLLKIGDTTFTGDLEADARRRIDDITRTAGIKYDLLHKELAVTQSGEAFRDYDVHRVLKNSNVAQKSPSGTTAREWFAVDLLTVRNAIAAVKRGESHLPGASTKKFFPVNFRDEQDEAITRTVEHFKRNDRFLWNAKMRFGKTLCALEVVRRCKFAKTIIVTHRPVVNQGWYEDFKKIFGGTKNFIYGDKNSDFDKLAAGGKKFIYFASMQDLRGSETVGGKFFKRAEIFSTDWSCVIVDEAHEGTTTALGDKVISELVKPKTKFLALSGTPFNILDDFDEDNVYTWDYIDEQRAKADWEKNFPDLSNPYDKLPRMNIFTYDLGQLLKISYVDEEKFFNFREFFRVEDETFAHEADVKNFLDLLIKRDANNYPFANKNFRDMFCHTLWIIPGVKEGRALSQLLQSHKVFGSFKVVNVAGDGDSDDEPADALKKVRDAIDNYSHTITLSCGKLTAGVTVPEWSAVFMLAGSYSTSAMNYLQTIFRVQSPCNKNGVVKKNCYVFDFAPDRTLKMLAESVAVSARAGHTTDSERQTLDALLNFCPVIAMHGSQMKSLDAKKILGQLKRAYAERAVRTGFDNKVLYNDELLKLDDIDLENFQQLGEIIGSSKAQRKTLVINAQGLTGAEQKKLSDKLKREPTPEEKELARRKRQRVSAISILRGISIRMPLLIYGADVPLDDDITIDDFADLIDDASWKEFMPKGVTKKIFANFIKYYDREIFIEAGHRIRQRAKNADDLSPTDRVKKIADLFATFKNPDKETVLTPWKVINLHLNSLPEKIFAPDKKILDINAKTGLYPLWVAQKIFHARTDPFGTLPLEAQRIYWSKVVAENVFVVCKTPMAKKITQRTLLGYRDGKINAQFFDNLINTLKTNPAAFVAQVKKLWLGDDKMFFDAVVGNPPYQIAVEGDNKNYASPVYHLFLDTAFKLADKVSLITPAKFLSNAGDTPSEFNQRLLSDEHFTVVRYERDSSKFFPASYIEGGVVITLRDTSQTFEPIGIFTAFDELNSILQKVIGDENFQSFSKIMRGQMTYKLSAKAYEDFSDLTERLPKRTDTALRTNAFEVMPDIFLTDKPDDGQEYLKILGKLGSERVYRFVRRDYMEDLPEYKTYKVFVPAANGASGKLGDEAARIISKPVVGEPREGCTQTFITVGAFDSRAEADACLKYIKTKFARVMLGVLKVTQHNPPATWAKVPLQNFTATGDIDWSQSIADIDAQLYRKYHLTDAEIKFIEEHVKAME